MTEDKSKLFNHFCSHGESKKYMANLFCPQCKQFKCNFCEDDHLMVNTATLVKWISIYNKIEKQADLISSKKKCLNEIDKYYNTLKQSLNKEYELSKAKLTQLSYDSKVLPFDVSEMFSRGIPQENIGDILNQEAFSKIPINNEHIDKVIQYKEKLQAAQAQFDELELLSLQDKQ